MNRLKLSCRVKEAEVDPSVRTAQSLIKIFQFMFHRIPQKERHEFFLRLKNKIVRLQPSEIGMKNIPEKNAVGQAASFAKNLLSGLDPFFIKRTLMEVAKLLSLQ
jgi:hypothetical protein